MVTLLLSVVKDVSADDIDGQRFTDVLDDLARDSLGLQEIQVRYYTHACAQDTHASDMQLFTPN